MIECWCPGNVSWSRLIDIIIPATNTAQLGQTIPRFKFNTRNSRGTALASQASDMPNVALFIFQQSLASADHTEKSKPSKHISDTSKASLPKATPFLPLVINDKAAYTGL